MPNKESLGWFPNQAFSQCVTKAQRLYLRAYTEVSTEMSQRKPYAPPSVLSYESEAEYPDWTRGILLSLRQALEASQFEVKPQYVTVVDSDRRYVEVSDSFCQLIGYQREELVGMRSDDLTAPNTNDIPTVFGLFQKLGYMHGLWLLVSREGTRILVRYEAWLRPDSYIEGHMEVVGAGY
jgi:PAS domain S-box-containing protein